MKLAVESLAVAHSLNFVLLLFALGAGGAAAYYYLQFKKTERSTKEQRHAFDAVSNPARTPTPSPEASDKAWSKLVNECVDLMNELDEHAARGDEQQKNFSDFVVMRLEDVLDRCGVEKIENDTTFDIIRHRVEGGRRASEGAPINQTVRPGFCIGKRVLRRALVRVDMK